MTTIKQEKALKLLDSAGTFNILKIYFNNLRSQIPESEELVAKFEERAINGDVALKIADIYCDTFSEEEIDKAIEWTTSEAGKRFTSSKQEINDKINPIFANISKQLQQELIAEQLNQEIEESLQDVNKNN